MNIKEVKLIKSFSLKKRSIACLHKKLLLDNLAVLRQDNLILNQDVLKTKSYGQQLRALRLLRKRNIRKDLTSNYSHSRSKKMITRTVQGEIIKFIHLSRFHQEKDSNLIEESITDIHIFVIIIIDQIPSISLGMSVI